MATPVNASFDAEDSKPTDSSGLPAMLDEILRLSPAVVYYTEAVPPYRIEYISPNLRLFLRIDDEKLTASGGWFHLVHPDDVAPTLAQFEVWLQGDSTRDLNRRYRIMTHEGSYIWVEDTCRKVFKEGRLRHIAGAALDITRQQKVEETLRKIAEVAPGMIYQFERRADGRYRIPYASHQMRDLFGVDPGDVENDLDRLLNVFHPDDVERVMQSVEASERTQTFWSVDYRVCVNGDVRWLHGQSTPERTPEGGTLWHGLVMDITRQKQLEQELREMSIRDALTGLFNRRYFFDVVSRELDRFGRTASPFCLIMVDLDKFKAINDRHGHAKGDEVLIAFAGILKARLRRTDVSARLGGEEFVIFLPDTLLDQAFWLGEEIRADVAAIRLSGARDVPFGVTASFGLTHCQSSDRHPDDLLRRADLALYQAKHQGRNQVVSIPAIT
ncbi:sensor domain-containing diguanylate cyclase [Ectothiorhodospira lacustris]|uniref:sensor domain-containing diguanylate cyclase n=1 Tax=Ectothiorhodospira lacustris TaxID=2899127 RepID=UPI001EE99EB5|nr:sensor domain-containing diguanylate cyclase [Ectothiorhodospira lacustris]MCG5499312.1 diguanylate cyclase [Ectothiorhodospira lacustris]MCG5509201.1 diguanylate cyclase [Ectothiorhodospira lacustris]MCG5520991.1 diguanylate cyclase [Ectothiorhodospira lacustris]